MHAELLEQVRNLPLMEQVELADEIMEGLPLRQDRPAHLSSWQDSELKRRIEEYDAAPSSAIPWEEVKADVEKQFGWKL